MLQQAGGLDNWDLGQSSVHLHQPLLPPPLTLQMLLGIGHQQQTSPWRPMRETVQEVSRLSSLCWSC